MLNLLRNLLELVLGQLSHQFLHHADLTRSFGELGADVLLTQLLEPPLALQPLSSSDFHRSLMFAVGSFVPHADAFLVTLALKVMRRYWQVKRLGPERFCCVDIALSPLLVPAVGVGRNDLRHDWNLRVIMVEK